MRFFNTAGPVRPELHYCLPPLARLDLEEVLLLEEKIFHREEEYRGRKIKVWGM